MFLQIPTGNEPRGDGTAAVSVEDAASTILALPYSWPCSATYQVTTLCLEASTT
jgi:hypothetical protein